jgi:hypothetical protein
VARHYFHADLATAYGRHVLVLPLGYGSGFGSGVGVGGGGGIGSGVGVGGGSGNGGGNGGGFDGSRSLRHGSGVASGSPALDSDAVDSDVAADSVKGTRLVPPSQRSMDWAFVGNAGKLVKPRPLLRCSWSEVFTGYYVSDGTRYSTDPDSASTFSLFSVSAF